MNFQDKHVSIIGLVRSGVAVAKLLDDMGAQVLVSDLKSENDLRASLAELQGRDIQYVLGGHDERCIEKADLIVVSPAVPLDIPILKAARDLDIPIVGELEIACRISKAPIIAITGTKGKSTTTTLIGDILMRGKIARGQDGNCRLAPLPSCPSFPISYNNVYVAGNIGVALSQKVQHVTAEDLVVVEVSSFQLESTEQFHPIVSVILNITTDHLDRHKTMEQYVNAKKRIFLNQTSQDYIVLNADDNLVKSFADEAKAKPIFFSRRKSGKQLTKEIPDFTGTYIENDYIVAKVNIPTLEKGGSGDFPICRLSDIQLLGAHNLENVLAASAVGIIFGLMIVDCRLSIEKVDNYQSSITNHQSAIREAISNFHGLEHALQVVGELNGVKFINDSKATNVDSVRVALEAIENNIILIMGGYDKGNNYSPLVELVKAKVKMLILLGEHTAKIRDALGAYATIYPASTMREAVSLAYSRAQKGDYVLLSPANASFDMFTDYRERGNAFREAVRHVSKMS
ncbi:UDP-N-acetylmuramoyl-L-alanine--D-glutamate ligase [Candidatus Poribacteria bacterium]|nr:UDP-N-acetylmuramoyl-L-alanine--D-glutamate ligase [Candidatus Poribacteria bacterium]